MCIQREPQHLHSNAVFIGLCPPPAREDDKQSLPQRSFHVFNHPRHASGFLPDPPSLQSVSFCGEAGQVPCLGWRAVSHESAASPTSSKQPSKIQLWPHRVLHPRRVPSGMCLREARELSNTVQQSHWCFLPPMLDCKTPPKASRLHN